MYKGKKILAVIPARGGSKGLPRKNVRMLAGKPLIVWSIEQAKSSRYLDRIIVSTDDVEIANVSKQYEAEVPFMRPAELAVDTSSTFDVILHAIDYFEAKGEIFDYLALLEPTSPLREKEDIDICIEYLIDNEKVAKSIVSVARLESSHPDFNVVIDKDSGLIKRINGETDFKVLRRQDLEDVYFFEGSIYISEIKTLISKRGFYHGSTMAYVVPRWKSLEVDELMDLINAEALLKARQDGLF